MLDMVIGAIIGLIAAVAVVFLVLLTANIMLVHKLRSIIPPSPNAGPADQRLRSHRSEKAADTRQSVGRAG